MSTNDSRHRQRRAFLDQGSFAGAELTALAADMSPRRYFRLRGGPHPALLMDAPPEHVDTRPFVRVARHLRQLGYSAPAVYDWDEGQGFLILEDFGNDTYTRLLAAGADERALYELAVDTLCALHRERRCVEIELPPYDVDALLDEACLLPEWYLPWLQQRPVAEELCLSFAQAWRELLSRLPVPPPHLVLRDFHVDNLMHLPQRSGIAACGLLDFQDAVIGPAAYDVMSLLEDARRDIAPELVRQLIERYRLQQGMDDASFSDFMSWYRVLAAQRHCKVLGIFVRFSQREGNDRQLRHLPRVARLLASHLDCDELAPLASWLQRVGWRR